MANELFLKACPSLTRNDTTKYTITDIEKECKEITNYLDIAYPFSKKKMSSVNFSVKWGKDMTNTLGSCHRYNENSYELTFNPSFFTIADSNKAHSVIIHEVLHMCHGCMKHTGEWKYRANNCKRHLGIEVTRCTNDTNYHSLRLSNAKYNIYCADCNKWSKPYQKSTKTIMYIMSTLNQKRYSCPVCHSHNLKIEVLK